MPEEIRPIRTETTVNEVRPVRTETVTATQATAPVVHATAPVAYATHEQHHEGHAVPGATAHRRISWGAIFAGVVMALISQLAFSLLGLGFGASAFNPYDDNHHGLGTGAAIYTLLTVLISLFTGGYVAGRLAGFPRRQDSMLHGLVTFGLTSLLGFYLLGSGLGAIIGGAGSLVGSVIKTAGQAASSAAPGLVDAAKSKLQDSGVDLSDLQGQVDQLLRQTGKPELQPENLQGRANDAADQAKGTGQAAAQDPNAAKGDLKGLVTSIFSKNKDVLDAADKDALVNVVMSRTGKSRPEAEQIVNNYQQTYEQAKAKAKQVADETKAKATEVADDARKGASKAGYASSLALLLGALAAAIGGRAATPRDYTEAPLATGTTGSRRA